MKVRELIEKLRLCDPESYIVTVDNESGWNDYNAVWKMRGSVSRSSVDCSMLYLSEHIRPGDETVEVVAISPYGHDGYPAGAVEVKQEDESCPTCGYLIDPEQRWCPQCLKWVLGERDRL